MTLGEQQEKFMDDVCNLLIYAKAQGFFARGKELLRTPEQQAIYVKTGKSKTNNSRHLDGLAIDLIFTNDHKAPIYDKSKLQKIGDYWESLDECNRWGGNYTTFLDCPHFERLPQKIR